MAAFRNEIDDMDVLECPHGQLLKNCHEPQCGRDWDLLRKNPDSPDPVVNPMVGKYSLDTEERSALDNLSDNTVYRDWERKEWERKHGLPDFREDRPRSLGSFLNKEAVDFGRYYRLLNETQSKILWAIAELKEAAGSEQNVREFRIAKLTGLSRRTIQKERPKLKPFLTDGPTLRTKIEEVRIVRYRGERKRQFYLVCSARLGERKQLWRELVAGKELARLKGLGVPLEKEVLVPIPDSPMRILLHKLWTALVHKRGKRTTYKGPDWNYNIEWARKRVFGKSKSADAFQPDAILTRLTRKLPICRQCHTPILAGCKLAGKRITRGREYCDDACKMKGARRRQRKLP